MLALALLIVPLSAHALLLFDTANVTFSTLGPNLSSQVDTFDPALGTLDSVHVSISGTLGATAFTFTNPACLPPAPACPPVPYQFALELGVRGLGGQFFVLNGAEILFSGVAVPNGQSVSGIQAFNINLQFDASSDFTGIVPASTSGVASPPSVSGQRADFFESLAALDQLRFDLLPSSLFPLIGALPVFDVNGGAAVLVQYDYTPHAVAVSEPPTAWLLFAVTAIGLLLRRRLCDRAV